MGTSGLLIAEKTITPYLFLSPARVLSQHWKLSIQGNVENDAVEIILEVIQQVCSSKGNRQVLLTSVDDSYIQTDRKIKNCTVY